MSFLLFILFLCAFVGAVMVSPILAAALVVVMAGMLVLGAALSLFVALLPILGIIGLIYILVKVLE